MVLTQRLWQPYLTSLMMSMSRCTSLCGLTVWAMNYIDTIYCYTNKKCLSIYLSLSIVFNK